MATTGQPPTTRPLRGPKQSSHATSQPTMSQILCVGQQLSSALAARWHVWVGDVANDMAKGRMACSLLLS